MKPGSDLHNLFHTLWGRAKGRETYDKKDWLALEAMLIKLGDAGNTDLVEQMRAANRELQETLRMARPRVALWLVYDYVRRDVTYSVVRAATEKEAIEHVGDADHVRAIPLPSEGEPAILWELDTI